MERSVRREILALDYEDYLRCIFAICEKASRLYRGRMPAEYEQLVTDTLSVFSGITTKNFPEATRVSLEALTEKWAKASDEGMGGTGQINLTFTFENICEELIDRAPAFEGAKRALVPFTDLPEDGLVSSARGIRRVDNREIDPDGLIMQMLSDVRRIIAEI